MFLQNVVKSCKLKMSVITKLTLLSFMIQIICASEVAFVFDPQHDLDNWTLSKLQQIGNWIIHRYETKVPHKNYQTRFFLVKIKKIVNKLGFHLAEGLFNVCLE